MKFSSKIKRCELSPVRKFYPYEMTAVEKGLKGLENKPVRHTGVCEIGQQAEAVLESLK